MWKVLRSNTAAKRVSPLFPPWETVFRGDRHQSIHLFHWTASRHCNAEEGGRRRWRRTRRRRRKIKRNKSPVHQSICQQESPSSSTLSKDQINWLLMQLPPVPGLHLQSCKGSLVLEFCRVLRGERRRCPDGQRLAERSLIMLLLPVLRYKPAAGDKVFVNHITVFFWPPEGSTTMWKKICIFSCKHIRVVHHFGHLVGQN